MLHIYLTSIIEQSLPIISSLLSMNDQFVKKFGLNLQSTVIICNKNRAWIFIRSLCNQLLTKLHILQGRLRLCLRPAIPKHNNIILSQTGLIELINRQIVIKQKTKVKNDQIRKYRQKITHGLRHMTTQQIA